MILIPLIAGASITGITVPIVLNNRSKTIRIDSKEMEKIAGFHLDDHILESNEIEKVFKNKLSEPKINVPDAEWIEKFRSAVTAAKKISEEKRSETNQSQELSKDHREALMQMYLFYSNLRGKTNKNAGTETLSLPKEAIKNLDKIEWNKENVKKIKEGNNSTNNWGWGNWDSNPFKTFFSREEDWKDAMKKDTEAKSEEQGGKKISEVELHIAIWLIRDIARIHSELSKNQ